MKQNDEQCSFQLFGRRCELQKDMCAERHLIKAKYCDFHLREEYLDECMFQVEVKSA